MIVRAAHPSHFGWVLERVGYAPTAAFRAIEAIDASGRIHGMVGYDMWSENAVWMHVALENPAALRALLRPAFAYPFVEAGRDIALASVRESNVRSRALVERVGFREVWRCRDAVRPGEDGLVYELRRAECRWIAAERKAA